MRIHILDTNSYKIGVNEIAGLNEAMLRLMKPIQNIIKDKIYWSAVEIDPAEYLRRDGFIPHSHNFGGFQISETIPKCQECDFGFLNFGECDDKECDHESECGYESEGHLDAHLRIWFKFEGYDETTGELSFYLVCAGGNGDAPYFRTKYEDTYFEAEFKCKSVEGLNRAASKHFKALAKLIS